MKKVLNHSGRICVWLSALSILALVGCSSYTLKTPRTGLTNSLLTSSPTSAKYFDSFDSTKGLFVFSYRIEGKNGIGGTDNFDVKEGLRIWEHRFKPGDAESITKMEVMNLYKQETPMLTVSKVTRTYQTIPASYRRGRIVYGGHLKFEARDKNSGSNISLIPNDEEYGKFLAAHPERIKTIPIDTVIPKNSYTPGDDF